MNKKNILGSIAVLSIAAMAAWNVNVNSDSLSDVSLANVEALAGEVVYGVCETPPYVPVCGTDIDGRVFYGRHIADITITW